MRNYRSSFLRNDQPQGNKPHGVWRSRAHLIMILIPVIYFASACETINHGLELDWRIPYQLRSPDRLPGLIVQFDALTMVLSPNIEIKHRYADLAAGVMAMIMVFHSGLRSIIYAILYRIIGPAKWGSLEVSLHKLYPLGNHV